MKFTYKTRGVCSSAINIEIEDDIIKNVEFIKGCPGNTRGVAVLSRGRNIDEIISLLKGTPCHGTTSCPDQLAQALEYYKNNLKDKA